jgi:hypothetical protein
VAAKPGSGVIQVRLTAERLARLRAIARARRVRDAEVIETALDLLFAADALLTPAPRPEDTRRLSEQERERLFEDYLRRKGIIDDSPPEEAAYDGESFVPVEVQGTPLSEEIIQSRR